MNVTATSVRMVPRAMYVTHTHTHTSLPVFMFIDCLNLSCVQDAFNSFTCECAQGWTGEICANDINECVIQPCQNGGSCFVRQYWLCVYRSILIMLLHFVQNTFGSFTCGCAPGFTGPRCDGEIDECASDPCQNGANCYVSAVPGHQWVYVSLPAS